tara:strand:- start:790 stop:1629 length:840 start_codon:yes stop_codon:yes gene_type:complete
MTKQQQTEHNMLMEFIQHDCKVDIDKKIDYPPVALSYGEKLLKSESGDKLVPIALGTYGNLSVVTAPPKTMKTFFISLLASVYLSGTNIYGGNLKGHKGNGHLLHIDTEQGLWHCQKVFKRPLTMDSSININNYHTFGLRSIDHKMRIDFIDYYLENKIKKPSLIIIDGIADLCSDANSIVESNALVQRLMEWSSKYKCHIINVIHQNYGSQKFGTGHLGSFLEKKAETVIALEANTVNKEWVTVKCGRSRGYSFDTFSFEVNDVGLPQIVNNIYDPLA